MRCSDMTTCELCGKAIKDGSSIDISICRTLFDEKGEVIKTMDDVSDLTDWDCVIIGNDCCKQVAKEAWTKMLTSMGI